MFEDAWKWAGEFRKIERNIGITPFQTPIELQKLLNDVQFQIKNKSFPLDEIAYRFHHRLVAINLFPNGNGRHARLITDYILLRQGEERFA